jgi:hypothetical protein
MPDQLKIKRRRSTARAEMNGNSAHFCLAHEQRTAGYHTKPSVRRKYPISRGNSFSGFAGTPP